MTDTPVSPPFRSGYIVLAGKANVGKSTLFNALLGEQLSIVSPKPQTTRDRILGILTSSTSQMIFLDTPGLLKPRYRLHELMHGQIQRALRDADLLLAIIDASDFETTFDDEIQRILQTVAVPLVIALNKCDLVDGLHINNCLTAIGEAVNAQDILPVSAHTGDNISQLQALLEKTLPLGPVYYPEEMLTEHPERFFVAELIREQLFIQLRQELPYATAVKIEEFREDRPKTYIHANIIVERDSQKGIVIGSNGKTLKSIGKNARQTIETFLNRPIYLDLRVKVYENWRKKDTALRGFGYGI